MVKAQHWIKKRRFEGEPKDEDMELVEVELPELKENEVLLEAVYLSVDPYMRPFTDNMPVPMVMIGESLSKVIETKNGAFPLGTLVLASAGWRSHFISDGSDLSPVLFDLGSTSPSHCLGALGMPGAAAYFGLYKICDPKAGETVIVNGAAGAVGNIVGQLAKIRGCTVIAFVGSDEKLNWCKNDLKFDHVFNYKKRNFSEAIASVCPDGADVFFDNAGGEWFPTIINKHLKHYARVCCCGSIETYNVSEQKKYPPINFTLVLKEISIKGFLVATYKNEWPAAFTEMNAYIQDGRLKVKETVYEGFGNMRKAFYGLFKGENIGKAIVKA